MKLKYLSKQSLLIVSTVGIMLMSLIVFFLTKDNSALNLIVDKSVLVAQSIRPSLHTAGIPIEIKIPAIGVSATIESVGIKLNGELDVPVNIKNAAWFNMGPRPGDVGSAVIDGHFGWKDGKEAVFDNLYKLNVGDKIIILDARKVAITFIVRELRRYGEKEDSLGVFISDDGKMHLNLITCNGIWNKVSKSYSNRLVVFADKEIL
ncbi:MAG: class F sortase [Minisyncoccia bacterium]